MPFGGMGCLITYYQLRPVYYPAVSNAFRRDGLSDALKNALGQALPHLSPMPFGGMGCLIAVAAVHPNILLTVSNAFRRDGLSDS